MPSLHHIVAHLDDFDRDLTIFVVGGCTCAVNADAVVARETDDGELPLEALGMDYLLEVDIAQDAIHLWTQWRNGKLPSDEERLMAVLYYARNDAYLPEES